MAGWYYRQLDRSGREVYDGMRAGFAALAPAIRLPRLEGSAVEIYLRLKLDEPLLFHVTGFKYRFDPRGDHIELIPEYLFDKGRSARTGRRSTRGWSGWTRPLRGKSELEREQAIHDFMLENVRYDKLKKSYSHEIIGPLTQGVGVCEDREDGEGAVRRGGAGVHRRAQ